MVEQGSQEETIESKNFSEAGILDVHNMATDLRRALWSMTKAHHPIATLIQRGKEDLSLLEKWYAEGNGHEKDPNVETIRGFLSGENLDREAVLNAADDLERVLLDRKEQEIRNVE